MKVNAIQIEQLFQFTRKHYVEWYDLQSELVDHLANGIERQWLVDPELSFDDALQKEFKKFGVFGFMEVVEERQKSLGKKYSKLILKHVLEFFKLPKILMLVLLSVTVFYVLRLVDGSSDIFYGVLIAIFAAYFVLLVISSYRKKKKALLSNEKSWLFKEIILNYGAGLGIGLLPLYLFNILIPKSLNFQTMNIWVLGSFSFILVLMFIMIYIMHVEIPQKAEEYLEETYPEYKLVD
ncbi:hypothetical protein [Nonlabens sp.]|uniref:hypothetical protein n=1 Tax=Nonlabens sp. TaxID=1888209 RepID=UPI003F6A4817